MSEQRSIDGKFSITSDLRVINTVSGQEVPQDEPLLVLRARDWHAVATIESYKQLCETDCNDLHLAGIEEIIQRFLKFRSEHPERMKQPGITKHLKLAAPPSTEAGVTPPIKPHSTVIYTDLQVICGKCDQPCCWQYIDTEDKLRVLAHECQAAPTPGSEREALARRLANEILMVLGCPQSSPENFSLHNTTLTRVAEIVLQAPTFQSLAARSASPNAGRDWKFNIELVSAAAQAEGYLCAPGQTATSKEIGNRLKSAIKEFLDRESALPAERPSVEDKK